MILISVAYKDKKEVRKYEGEQQYYTQFIYEIQYKTSPRGRIIKKDVYLAFSAASKEWYSKNGMKDVAESMNKDWKVKHSGLCHISPSIGNLWLELDSKVEFESEEEALAYFYKLYNNNGYSNEVVLNSILKAIENQL